MIYVHSFLFRQFWSACSEQKLLAKQEYIIITLADVLSKAKLYFSLSFQGEKIKQEKTAEYIDRSKQSKARSHICSVILGDNLNCTVQLHVTFFAF